MIDFFLELSNKDKFTFIGIIITATTGFFTLLISLKLNKKSSYVNSITNERINSMTQLKLNAANYISILKLFYICEKNQISYEKMYNLKLHIEFQLNFLKENEKLIVQRMDKISNLINYTTSIKKDITVKEILEEIISRGIDKERLPIPYTENTRLDIDKAKEFLKRVINMEVGLLENDLKKHIKAEWEKIKMEI